MTFLLSQIEEYNMNTEIGKTSIDDIEDVSLFSSISKACGIFWGILTFNISAGTELLPIWFNLLIAIPFYCLIIYFIMDIIFPQISD